MVTKSTVPSPSCPAGDTKRGWLDKDKRRRLKDEEERRRYAMIFTRTRTQPPHMHTRPQGHWAKMGQDKAKVGMAAINKCMQQGVESTKMES